MALRPAKKGVAESGVMPFARLLAVLATGLVIMACGESATAVHASPSPTLNPKVPEPRGYAAMSDAATNRGVLLVGGFTRPPAPSFIEETWTYTPGLSASGWAYATAKPMPSAGDAMVCGKQCDHALYLTVSGEVWDLDVATMRWTKKGAPGPAMPLHGSRLAYDSQSDRMIAFGGDNFNEKPLNETWAYDPTADRWTQMHPKSSPPARYFFAMAYDEDSDRVIAFGGFGLDDVLLNDTWAYDYDHDVWTLVSPGQGPSRRGYCSMAYDSVGKRVVLFGGAGEGEAPFGDTWAFEMKRNSWAELKVTGPSARAWHAMSYDKETATLVLFGGGPTREAYTNDVWLFDVHSNAWSKAAGAG